MKKTFIIILTTIISITIGFSFVSCTNEDDYKTDKSVSLGFSSDTISFDTIFTTVGSVTEQIRVYNKEDKPIKLNYITLGGGSNSYYRLNVDGDTSLVAKDVEIKANDSIFIFVRVEIDPNNQNNPLLVQDSIVFDFNGKRQYVQLMAYGQDAYYHKPTHTLGETTLYSLANEGGNASGVEVSGNNITWKNDKPHIIIGTCVVDSAFKLNVLDGTKIYMANKADFWVYKDGTINVNGSTNSPVMFQSMRYQGRYSDIPGQWGKIWLMAGSKDNKIDNCIIKNATIGMVVDTNVTSNPTLTVSNSRIENCSSVGLYGRGANILGENLVVQNTGSYSVALTIGGQYKFIGCTFANYWSYDNNRTKATLLLNNYYTSTNNDTISRPITKAEFYNTIIYGSLVDDEIEFDLRNDDITNYKFDHCLLKSNKINNNSYFITNCLFNKDPLFNDATTNDLRLKKDSPAIGSGDGVWNSTLPYDIFGIFRPDPPSIGAMEYVVLNESKKLVVK
jgi:hypothetical protein